jgi:hypothetical protein
MVRYPGFWSIANTFHNRYASGLFEGCVLFDCAGDSQALGKAEARMTARCRARIVVLLVRQLLAKVFEGNLNAVVVEFLILHSKLITATGTTMKKLGDRR